MGEWINKLWYTDTSELLLSNKSEQIADVSHNLDMFQGRCVERFKPDKKDIDLSIFWYICICMDRMYSIYT